MNLINNLYLKKYLDLITRTYYRNVRVTKEYYNFRCPSCGDSKKNKKKKRGYILTKRSPWVYKCHNCGVSMLAEHWMKQFHPQYYKEYIKELLKDKTQEKNDKEENNIREKAAEIKVKVEESRRKVQDELKVTRNFIPILKGNSALFKKAIAFCKTRAIPEAIWHKWFVDDSGDYRGRLIIPFYDDKDTIYYFQARTLLGCTPKYINRRENRENAIYGWYNIDKTKPVIMTEGPIDALFLENGIATCGLLYSPEVQEKLDTVDVYYLLDPDEDGRKTAKKFLTEGRNVFLWGKFIETYELPYKEKWDINELVMYGKIKDKIKFDDIGRFFSNHIFDGIYL